MRKIVGVTVGTPLNPKKIADNMPNNRQVHGDWNENDETSPAYIKGRTHYAIKPNTWSGTLTFDGDVSKYEYVEVKAFGTPGYYVKLTDGVTKPEQLLGSTVVMVDKTVGELSTVVTDDILSGITDVVEVNGGSGDAYTLDMLFIAVQSEELVLRMPQDQTGTNIEEVILTKGVWVMCDVNSSDYIKSLTFNPEQETVKQLDMKFIPDALKTHYTTQESVTVTWDGNTEGLEPVTAGGDTLYHVSDKLLTNEQFYTMFGVITYANDKGSKDYPQDFSQEMTSEVIAQMTQGGYITDDYIYYPGALAFIRKDNCVTQQGVTFPKAGVYFSCRNIGNSYNIYVSKIVTKWEGKKLDEVYIPDTIATKEYVHQLLGTSIEEIASLIGGDA